MNKNKPRTGSIAGIHPDFSTQPLDNQLADGQPQACALHPLIQLLKPTEDCALPFKRNTATGIRHRELCKAHPIAMQA